MLAQRLAAIVLLCSILNEASAASRCGAKLVNSGDTLENVLQTCGQPVAQDSDGPVMRNNGVPRKGAQKTEVLVYGPNGGAYQYMLFINDKLIRVDTRRNEPSGNLLKWD
ncbi:DUF2845 domain-containing protein [Pseudomonas sp. ATCC PTA-122608]|uniref:DUF2845 domain-containing protein n=1 Tax=Pseudomonas sp. ATCC PTA-122608 TaxID=1771311 RepID=UPI00096BB5D0